MALDKTILYILHYLSVFWQHLCEKQFNVSGSIEQMQFNKIVGEKDRTYKIRLLPPEKDSSSTLS